MDPISRVGASEWVMVKKTAEEIEKEQVEENLKHWPWRQTVPRKLVTLAPYLMNNLRDTNKVGNPFALPEVVQTSPIFTRLLGNDLIRQKIVNLLFQNHDTAWKFAATSRQSWRYLTYDIASWDFDRGWFGNCEYPRDQVTGVDSSDEPICGSVSSVVIVSPVRGPQVFPENINDLEKVDDSVDELLYQRQIRRLHKMCSSMANFADYFRNIQLHRMPFLTTQVLELLIPMMRNLQVLGIYKCQLIHIGDTLKLLEIIKADKCHEKENQISLDFYPNYHIGPTSNPGNVYCVGSYGVTWDNWNRDSRLAIWQLLTRILPQAREQGVDFESPHTMFRQWLDKSPCWRVADTLYALNFGDDSDKSRIELCAQLDYPNTGGSIKRFTSKIDFRPESWEWTISRAPCIGCSTPTQNPLGIFFYYNDLREARNAKLSGNQLAMRCLGCSLTSVLNAERDHYKSEKREIIARWLREEDDIMSGEAVWNVNNMKKALQDFESRRVYVGGQSLDKIRTYRILRTEDPKDGLDRENDERQTPLRYHELGRLGMKNRSPTVQSKDPIQNEWNMVREFRKWEHGHGP